MPRHGVKRLKAFTEVKVQSISIGVFVVVRMNRCESSGMSQNEGYLICDLRRFKIAIEIHNGKTTMISIICDGNSEKTISVPEMKYTTL